MANKKIAQASEMIKNMKIYDVQGITVKISEDENGEDEIFIIPAPKDARLDTCDTEVNEHSKQKNKEEIKQDARMARYAAEAADIRENAIGFGQVMGRIMFLRALGCQVNIAYLEKQKFCIPYLIHVDGEVIYSADQKQAEEEERRIEELKEQANDDFEPEEDGQPEEMLNAEGTETERPRRLVLTCKYLSELCDIKEWYTKGSFEEYTKLMEIEKKKEVSLEDIAKAAYDIYMHSDEAKLEDITETLLQTMQVNYVD